MHAVGDHSGPIAERGRRGGASDPNRKEQSDAVRASEVEVFADHGFKEEPSLHRSVEDLREADFELIEREPMIVAGTTVGCWQRPRESMRPPVEEGLQVRGAKRIAGGLKRDGIGTREKPVVETLEAHALATQLLFHPFMAVETEFHRVREI